MATFLTGLVVLIVGGALYGTLIERIFKPDDRPTPAVSKQDGVDYVPMNKWKNSLINLLNIAGTGPIFGPIQGILFGPVAFITIPIGCVIAGATHDYLSGMISLRSGGVQMPGIVQKFLGNKVYQVYNIFLCFLMLLVGAVFTYTPGDLFASQICGFTTVNVWTWVIYAVILGYYLIATLFPIDKIIGKIYPVFGAILLLSAVGVFAGIFIKGYQLDNIDFSRGLDGIFNVYPLFDAEGNSGAGTRFIPVFFVTVACGILSGFHSTQCTLIGRSVTHEKEGKTTFYGMMILEGLIAMIWAAAAMGTLQQRFSCRCNCRSRRSFQGSAGTCGRHHRNPRCYRSADYIRRYSPSFLPSDDCRLSSHRPEECDKARYADTMYVCSCYRNSGLRKNQCRRVQHSVEIFRME